MTVSSLPGPAVPAAPTPATRARVRHRCARHAWIVAACWWLSVWLGTSLSPGHAVHMIALFAHLAGLVAGLGAALLTEYAALLWLLGRRTLAQMLSIERTLAVPLWMGLALLLASGAFLELRLTEPRTAIKLLAVLVLALNGVFVSAIRAELEHAPAERRFRDVPRGLRRRAVASAALSQIAWWTAVLVGMLNTVAR